MKSFPLYFIVCFVVLKTLVFKVSVGPLLTPQYYFLNRFSASSYTTINIVRKTKNIFPKLHPMGCSFLSSFFLLNLFNSDLSLSFLVNNSNWYSGFFSTWNHDMALIGLHIHMNKHWYISPKLFLDLHTTIIFFLFTIGRFPWVYPGLVDKSNHLKISN